MKRYRVLLCVLVFTLFNAFTSLAGMNLNQGTKVVPVDPSIMDGPQIEAVSNVPQLRGAGDPRECMGFHLIQAFPMFLAPSEGKVYIGSAGIGSTSPDINLGGTANYFTRSFNKLETQNIYKWVNDIIKVNSDKNFIFLGWEVQVKFQFDFTDPKTWTYTVEGAGNAPSTQNCPFPNNRFQTYVLTVAVPVNDVNSFHKAGIAGTVNWRNPSTNSLWETNFTSVLYFNSSN